MALHNYNVRTLPPKPKPRPHKPGVQRSRVQRRIYLHKSHYGRCCNSYPCWKGYYVYTSLINSATWRRVIDVTKVIYSFDHDPHTTIGNEKTFTRNSEANTLEKKYILMMPTSENLKFDTRVYSSHLVENRSLYYPKSICDVIRGLGSRRKSYLKIYNSVYVI